MSVASQNSIVDLIVTRMTTLNLAIGEVRANLGPRYRIGHSFFVPREDFEYDAGWYRRIVETEIDPLLEEYCIDDPDKKAYPVDQVRLTPGSAAELDGR